MASKKQIEANRRNSKRSTVPKTPEGKARSAQNAIKHGLTSRRVLLPDEDQDAYMEYLMATMAELEPLGNLETLLARRSCDVMWRLNRCAGIEVQLLVRSQGQERRAALGLETEPVELGEANWGAAFAGEQALTRLQRYESALQRNLDRTLKQLRQMQALRKEAESEANAAWRGQRQSRERVGYGDYAGVRDPGYTSPAGDPLPEHGEPVTVRRVLNAPDGARRNAENNIAKRSQSGARSAAAGAAAG